MHMGNTQWRASCRADHSNARQSRNPQNRCRINPTENELQELQHHNRRQPKLRSKNTAVLQVNTKEAYDNVQNN